MIRLICNIVLLALGLLVLFPAPVLFLWYVAIIVSEFSWMFIAVLLLLLFWGFRVEHYQLAGTIVGLLAIALYLLPIIQATFIGNGLKNNLHTAFSTKDDTGSQAFNIWKMIRMREKELPYKTLVYKQYPGEELKLDYYPSEITGKRPCVIVIHGGSWKGGDSRQLPELNSILAHAGYNVASVNYRLAPQNHSPAQYHDVKDAIVYLRSHADELNIDADNIVLLGRSAGGQLALLAAYRLYDMGIRGVISYYGPADMIWGYQNPANPWVYNSCEVLEDYLGGTYNQLPQAYFDSSPIEAVGENTVPTLLIQGKNDVLVAYGHSTRLAEKLRKYNIRHYFLSLPWATHGCDYNINGPSGQLSTYAVAQFLKSVTKTNKDGKQF